MSAPTRLSDFILDKMESILEQWVEFAKTINPPALTMDNEDLRDHAELILQTIAEEMRSEQNFLEQSEKSKGRAPTQRDRSAAEDHAQARIQSGYTIGQLFSEYRALRASVLHLWDKSSKEGLKTDPEDITRFNEAIDQAIAESITRYSTLLKSSQDMFLAILGHDLKNPLNTTIMSSMILMHYDDDEVISKAARIYNSSQRMNRLINDLMDYTRSQMNKALTLNLTPENLEIICKDIVEEHQIANPGHTFLLESKGTFNGRWDKDRIAQMFSNLLGNAVHHGSSLHPIEIKLSATIDVITIKVSNQGVPIAVKHIHSIFDPLMSFDPNIDASKTNLGLGLHITREIILAHKGTIDVTSSEDEGTTFTVNLPR